MQTGAPVQILPAHWESFNHIVGSVDLEVAQLRTDYSAGRR